MPVSLAGFGLLAVYATLLFLPGLLIAGAAGLRGWQLAAAAPLVTYGVAGVAGPWTARIGLEWNLLTFAVSSVVVAAVAAGARVAAGLLRRRNRAVDVVELSPSRPVSPVEPAGAYGRWNRADHLGVAAGVLVGAAIGAAAIVLGIGSLQSIHQDWDATFHANALYFIADTGEAAPSALRAVNNYAAANFYYPNAYHLVGAMVLQLTGATVPAVINAQMVLLPGLLSLSLVGMLRWAWVRPAVALTAGVLAGCFSAFPYDTLWRGPLLPYATAISLVPTVVLLLGAVLRTRRAAAVVLAGLGSVGIVALHPSVAFVGVVFAVGLAVQRWVADRRRILPELGLLVAVGAVAALAGLPHLLGALSTASAEGGGWPTKLSTGAALGELLFLSHARPYSQWWLVLVLGVGLATLGRIRHLAWWLAGGLFFAGVFVLATSYDTELAQTVTRPWWNDQWRIAAIVTLVLITAAASGLVAARDGLVGLLRRLPAARRRGAAPRAVALVFLLAVFGLLSNGFYVPANAERMARNQGNETVSAGERAAMHRLAELVPPGARVMNDPRDGSAWMLAIAGVRPVFGHVSPPGGKTELAPRRKLLLKHFNELDTNEAVQRLVRRCDIQYVFVSQGFVRPSFERAKGLRHLGRVDSLQLVYVNGQARIYRVELPPLGDSAPVLSSTRTPSRSVASISAHQQRGCWE